MYEVEKGIPLPEEYRKGSATCVLRKLEVTDSVQIPAIDATRFASAMTILHDRDGTRFTKRKLDDDTYRIWRIK